jgi:Leucine-rich repeat (LRR) protein
MRLYLLIWISPFLLSAQVDYTYKSLDDAKVRPDLVYRLKLKNKGLTSFPKVLCSFPNLTELDLSRNKITDFPSFISCMTQLKILRLSKNRLENITDEILKLEKLEYLDLWDNDISELPLDIFKMTNLTHIDIRGVALRSSLYETYLLLAGNKQLFMSEPCQCQEE